MSYKEKHVRNQSCSKYRYITNVGNGNRIASTVFAVLREVRKIHPNMVFGFQSATLLKETEDDNNRRFRLYRKIMSFITASKQSEWQAFAFEQNSYIFVIQRRFLASKKQILLGYGKIFKKTFI